MKCDRALCHIDYMIQNIIVVTNVNLYSSLAHVNKNSFVSDLPSEPVYFFKFVYIALTTHLTMQ